MMSDITNNSPRIENNYLELKAVSIVFRVSGLCINFMLGKKWGYFSVIFTFPSSVCTTLTRQALHIFADKFYMDEHSMNITFSEYSTLSDA